MTTEEIARIRTLANEKSAEEDAEFDEEDPTCGRCGTSMRLNDDMAEWQEDARANVCNDCAACYYIELYDEVPRVLDALEASQREVNRLAARMKELEEAIKRYSGHAGSCARLDRPGNETRCTCGLQMLMASLAAPSEPARVMPMSKLCPRCKGTGTDHRWPMRGCAVCDGRGTVPA